MSLREITDPELLAAEELPGHYDSKNLRYWLARLRQYILLKLKKPHGL